MELEGKNRYLALASVLVFLFIVISLIDFQITGEVTSEINDSEDPYLSISQDGVSDGERVKESFLVSFLVDDENLDYLEYNWGGDVYEVPLDFILSYDFNEAGVKDSSVNQNDGSGSGYDIKSGVFGSSYEFSQASSISSSDLGIDLSSDSFTLTGWIKSDSPGDVLKSSDGFVLKSTEMDWLTMFIQNDLHYMAPSSVFADSDYLYVADSYGSRIIKFDKSNLAIVDFYGENGSSQNEFNNIKGIFVDDDYVYVADSGNHRVVQLDKDDFSYVGQFGETSVFGNDSSHLNIPSDVFVNDNYLYVTDSGNHRVLQLGKNNFSYINQFGNTSIAGDGNSSLDTPLSVFVYNSTIYVLDSNNGKMKILDENMSYGGEYFSSGTGDLELNVPRGLFVDENFVYISDTNNHKIKVFNKENMTLNHTIGSSAGASFDKFNLPYDLFVGENLYIADFRNNRIKKYFDNFSYLADVARIDFRSRPDIATVNSLPFVNDDYIYMVHQDKGGILVVDKDDFSFVGKNHPVGIYGLKVNTVAISVEGDYFYLADSANMSLSRYWLNNFSLDFSSPIDYRGIGLSLDENFVYVSDYYNGKINKYYKNNLSLVESYGSLGTGLEQLRYVWNVYVDDEFVYIPDNYNHRVVKVWKNNMTYHSHLGGKGSGENQYNYILGIGGDSEYLYLADFNNERVKKIYKENLTYVDEVRIPLPPVGVSRSSQATIGISENDGVLHISDYSKQNYWKVWSENMTIFDSSEDVFSISSEMQKDKWNHFAIVVDRNESGNLNYTFYLNGELKSNYSGNYFMGFDDSSKISFGGIDSFGGRIDNFRVYDYALDSRRINGDMIANYKESFEGMIFELNQGGVLADETYDYSVSVYDKAGNSETLDLSVVGDSEPKASVSSGYIAIADEEYIYRDVEANLDDRVEFELILENNELNLMKEVSIDIVENDFFEMSEIDLLSGIQPGENHVVDVRLRPKEGVSLGVYEIYFDVNGVLDEGDVLKEFSQKYLVNLILIELPEPVVEVDEEQNETDFSPPEVEGSDTENDFIAFIVVGILILILVLIWILYKQREKE